MEQPEDAYPLIRMPRQVVAAVRNRNKGKPDVLLRDEFYRVQKDLVFLYHLHTQVNLQAVQDEDLFVDRTRLGPHPTRRYRGSGPAWLHLPSVSSVEPCLPPFHQGLMSAAHPVPAQVKQARA